MQTLKRLLLVLALAIPVTILMGANADSGCDPEPDDCVGPDCEQCEPTVATTDQYYDRFEGTSFANECESDEDCVIGGCSGEVCAAESVFTTCEVLPYGPTGNCGCLDGYCQWYSCQ